MKNIFLVKSPLQLLNAIEARHHFKLSDDDCYLVLMGDRKSYTQMIKLVDDSRQWKNIVLMNRVSLFSANPWQTKIDYENLDTQRNNLTRSSIYTIWRLNRLAKTIADVEYVFIGDNNNLFMRHFVNTLKHKESILLDDGTATIDIASQRLQGLTAAKPVKTAKKIKLLLKRLLQGLKDQQPEKVTFFTAYKIEVNEPDRLVANDFTYLRNRQQSLRHTGEVYFLGSPLSEVGLMEEQDFIHQLALVRSEFQDSGFIYVAHRREKKEKLDAIEQQLHIKVRLFDYPIEYQLAMIGPRPAKLVSFISSALDNLSIIMGDRLAIISFKLIEDSYSNKDRIDQIYKHYESTSNESFQVRSVGPVDP